MSECIQPTVMVSPDMPDLPQGWVYVEMICTTKKVCPSNQLERIVSVSRFLFSFQSI